MNGERGGADERQAAAFQPCIGLRSQSIRLSSRPQQIVKQLDSASEQANGRETDDACASMRPETTWMNAKVNRGNSLLEAERCVA